MTGQSEQPAGRSETLEEVIYLDNQATTPTDPRVVDAMAPFFAGRFGNPHSIHHAYGRDAETAVERARTQVAALIGAEPREIVFTSGATESNNLAIKGAAWFHKERRPHLVTLATEHKCVLESCRRMEREGVGLTVLPVRDNGLVDLARLEAAVTERTALVSIMAVNNEIGVIQPIEARSRSTCSPWASISSAFRATSSTALWASARSTFAAARACGCCLCSTAAGRSGASGPARCRGRSASGSARPARSPARRWPRRARASPDCATA